MGRWVQQALWSSLCRFQDAETHTEAERRVVQGCDREERRGIAIGALREPFNADQKVTNSSAIIDDRRARRGVCMPRMAEFQANPTRIDPYKNFNFCVKWIGKFVAAISRVTGLLRTTEGMEHREGCDPSTSRKSTG